MNTLSKHICKKLFIVLLILAGQLNASSQGRVLINEYLPWTNNGCGTTAEYVELMNFGPGPMDISCYVLTDGDYAITIPANTILQPGQYYVISGQDVISTGCANIDSAIKVNLNWNTCNCTSAPIPTTGDGLFTDGGSANEQVVLLAPNLSVVDAVVRAFPQEPSQQITTVTAGGCAPQTFNLDQMNIVYEVIGESAGRANAFAREIDGDCEWVKETAQSGGATNNKSGDNPSVNYTFNYTSTRNCGNTFGSVVIAVQSTNGTPTFPMNYIVAYDSNNDHQFDLTDQYTYGTDVTANSIEISGLASGFYRILVSTINGCSLKTFDFAILDCISVLPVKLVYFKHLKTEQQRHFFEWQIDEVEKIADITLEQSADNKTFTAASKFTVENTSAASKTYTATASVSQNKNFRLQIRTKSGEVFYSPTINTYSSVTYASASNKLWPNPVRNQVNIDLVVGESIAAPYSLYDIAGQLVMKGIFQTRPGANHFTLPTDQLKSGIYNLRISSADGQPLLSSKLMKQ